MRVITEQDGIFDTDVVEHPNIDVGVGTQRKLLDFSSIQSQGFPNTSRSGLMEIRTPKSIVADAPLATKKIPVPPYEYKLFLDMMRNDPVLTAAFDTIVEVCTMNGYYFRKKDEKTSDEQVRRAKKIFSEDIDFESILDNIFYNLILHQICYVEISDKEDGTKELTVLETSEMAIMYNQNAQIEMFVQHPGTEKQIEWVPDQMLLFRHRLIGNQIYPYPAMESIARTYTNNLKAHDYLAQIYYNMPPKLIHILKDASESQRKKYIAALKVAKMKYGTDIVATTKQGIQLESLFNPELFSNLLKVLKYLRQQILMITRVPPNWISLSEDESSQRGDSESRISSFERKVRKQHQVVANIVNRHFLPKLNLSGVELAFNNVSLQDEEKHITNASVLRSIGLDEKSTLAYLRDKGVRLPPDAKITTPVASQEARNQVSPSRRSEDKKNDKMSSNVGEKGTSKEGGDKLDEQKIKVRTALDTYDKRFW